MASRRGVVARSSNPNADFSYLFVFRPVSVHRDSIMPSRSSFPLFFSPRFTRGHCRAYRERRGSACFGCYDDSRGAIQCFFFLFNPTRSAICHVIWRFASEYFNATERLGQACFATRKSRTNRVSSGQSRFALLHRRECNDEQCRGRR